MKCDTNVNENNCTASFDKSYEKLSYSEIMDNIENSMPDAVPIQFPETSGLGRSEFLKQVQAADFYALDLQLYLDTHPDCVRALTLYKNAVISAKKLRAAFEARFGPLTAMSSSAKAPWQWAANPWTWDKERS